MHYPSSASGEAMARPAIAFVGDDFTGASDALATLARGGLKTRLYTRFPDKVPDDLDAIGIATELRAMSPQEARAVMEELAPEIVALGARITHLKVCSTFDSSPTTGNICVVAETLEAALGAGFTAIVGGQPSLGRYCLFGTLFAAAGDGKIHRIDRHPVMKAHPITPMAEADLRRHLEAQGWSDIGLVDYRSYAAGPDSLRTEIARRIDEGERRALFDISSEKDIEVVGRALWDIADGTRILCVGASSIAEAVSPLVRADAALAPIPPSLPVKGPVLILSGSRSPTTAAQIEAAGAYEKIEVAAADIVKESAAAHKVSSRSRALLDAGRNVLVSVAAGSDGTIAGRELSRALAKFAAHMLGRVRPRCLVVAGGDTSSAIISGLDVEALEFVRDIDPGVSLLRARGTGAVEGLPMVLKGGQMGRRDLFDRL
jgi:uncharacterized protein YgbK (DUF1537 family)